LDFAAALCALFVVAFFRLPRWSKTAEAGSLSSLPDPDYAHRPFAPQQQPVVRRIRHIVYPTLGAPALVSQGGRFQIWMRKDVSDIRPVAWKVRLATRWDGRGGQTYLARVVRVSRSPERGWVKLDVALPLGVPREHFHLRVRGPGGLEDSQPRAVRVLERDSGPYTFVVMGDHQLWDPSWKVSPGDKNSRGYPKRGQKDINKRITLQTIREMELLDPDFVLYVGDLLYGLDYSKEYPEMWSWWHQNRLATFMVPGNHDAYAIYEVKIKGNLARMGRSFLTCRRTFPTKADWWQIWKYLSCVYSDIKEVLFDNLVHDGLESWKRTFGPPYYSFEVGPYHFVAVNSYDGTNRRRHGFSLYIPIKSLRLGAPAVDNYGGYISVEQLRWLERDVKEAASRGKTIVFFSHNDPRGNLKGERYHVNEPFPTDPVGLDHFEEWNFDARRWDSNPRDTRGPESRNRNNGHALLRLVARYGSYYFSGHVHEDAQTVYRPGQRIVGKIKARKKLEFIRVTTAASGVRPGGYWGYRFLRADRKGKIDTRPYFAEKGLLSVPAGNFWKKVWRAAEGPEVTLVSGLPKPLLVSLRFRLAFRPKTGYRFVQTMDGTHGRTLDLPVRRVSVDRDERLATYWVRAWLPKPKKATFPHSTAFDWPSRIRTKIARNNRPPDPRIVLIRGDGKKIVVRGDDRAKLPIGSSVVLDGSPSRDPEGKKVASYVWKLVSPAGRKGGGSERRSAQAKPSAALAASAGRRPGAGKLSKSVPSSNGPPVAHAKASAGKKPNPSEVSASSPSRAGRRAGSTAAAGGKTDGAAKEAGLFSIVSPPPSEDELGRVRHSTKARVGLRLDRLGEYRAQLTVYDEHGARSTLTYSIESSPPSLEVKPRRRCGCASSRLVGGSAAGTAALVVLLIAAAAGLVVRARRKRV
jgi:hypothetical protein